MNLFPSLLLHTETSDGTVVPIWEEVKNEDVVVLKDIMANYQGLDDVLLQYNRIPITAEKPPDYSDLKELIEVVLRNSSNTPIVVNCQLGRGRSTLASVCICNKDLLQIKWKQRQLIDHTRPHPTMASKPPPDNSDKYETIPDNVTSCTLQTRHPSLVPSNQ